jgi:hypothetical protein
MVADAEVCSPPRLMVVFISSLLDLSTEGASTLFLIIDRQDVVLF